MNETKHQIYGGSHFQFLKFARHKLGMVVTHTHY